MTNKIAALIITFSLAGHLIFSQKPDRPKELNIKGTYIHEPTKTEFPDKISGFQRAGLFSFDKKKENIGATYKTEKMTFSVYVYPAGDGTEGRLRNQYLRAMRDMANASDNGIHAEQGYKSFQKGAYKINGFSAITTEGPKSQLTLFECGQWFFKIRITTNSSDTSEINSLEKELLNSFDPTNLVKHSRLNPLADIHLAKAAFCDSLMLGSVIGSAYKKVEWARNNVDSLERAAGFPDLYLGLHVESLKEFTQFEKRKNWKGIQSTSDYLNGLNQLIDAGFLEEFVMEQFDMIMIVPKEISLDYEGFQKWKQTHPVKINLNELFYVVAYHVKLQ